MIFKHFNISAMGCIVPQERCYGPFRKRVLTDDQVKTRSLEWALTQYNWYHYKKGEPGHETGTSRDNTM